MSILIECQEDRVNLSDKNKVVLVTGASGAVGPRVVHALDQAGIRIRSFSVDTPTSGIFPQSERMKKRGHTYFSLDNEEKGSHLFFP